MMTVGEPLLEQQVVLEHGCVPVPVHFPGSSAAQVVMPPADWSGQYRTVLVHCGPEGPRPAGGSWTAGARWFG